jgi:hypothetical protein
MTVRKACEALIMDRPSAEIFLFLEAARVHRDRAAQMRRRGLAFNDTLRRKRFEALALKQGEQADELEAHALTILTLFERANCLTADIQTEIVKAKQTISAMTKTLGLD